MEKQALLTIERPLTLRMVGAPPVEVAPTAWRVGVDIGQLDGWRSVAGEAADRAWRVAARAVRSLAAQTLREGETVYAVGAGAADRLAGFVREWPAEDTWVSPPRPGIPPDTLEHDVIALKKSPFPPPDLVAGPVFRRIPAASFPDEEWWPCRWGFGAMALSFAPSSGGYREQLEDALRRKDYDLALKLMVVSARSSDLPSISTFETRPELLEAVSLYMTAGAPAECVVGVHFYSRRIDLSTFLSAAVGVLTSAGYQCFRSKGMETSKEWAVTGKLPDDLKIIVPETLLTDGTNGSSS